MPIKRNNDDTDSDDVFNEVRLFKIFLIEEILFFFFLKFRILLKERIQNDGHNKDH